MTQPGYLAVTVEQAHRVCVLSVSGELDITNTAHLFRAAAPAVAADSECFVLDLSGLAFTDVQGARALAAITHHIPVACPVVVQETGPCVHRVLELTGISLQPSRSSLAAAANPEDRARELILRCQQARSAARETMARSRHMGRQLAATETMVADTFIQLAAHKPQNAERLITVSQAARARATRYRQLASNTP